MLVSTIIVIAVLALAPAVLAVGWPLAASHISRLRTLTGGTQNAAGAKVGTQSRATDGSVGIG
jgi:hypothetical protein